MDFVVWQGLKIFFPEEWELMQFSKNSNMGSCAFANRYNISMELNWQRTDGEVNMGKTVTDHISKFEYEKGLTNIKRTNVSGWTGFYGNISKIKVSKFLKYFKKKSYLVQIIFIWPQKRKEEIENDILKNTKEEPNCKNDLQRWKSFGMDICISDKLKLLKCVVEPANAKMFFGVGNDFFEEYRRLGMVKYWLKGTVKQWLETKLPSKVKNVREKLTELSGHKIYSVYYSVWAKGLSKITGKKESYIASAWICPTDNRLYFARIKKDSAVDMCVAGERLVCCDRLAGE